MEEIYDHIIRVQGINYSMIFYDANVLINEMVNTK